MDLCRPNLPLQLGHVPPSTTSEELDFSNEVCKSPQAPIGTNEVTFMTLFLKFFPTSTPAKCLCAMRISGVPGGILMNTQSQLFLRSAAHCCFHRTTLWWTSSTCPSRLPPHPPCHAQCPAKLTFMNCLIQVYFVLASG